MTRRVAATVLAVLLGLTGVHAQVPRPGGDPMSELSDAQLFQAAWARQKLDLDNEGAIELYRFLVARKSSSPHRVRAIVRLLDLYRSRTHLEELGQLLRQLSGDSALPADLLEKVRAAASLVERRGHVVVTAMTAPKAIYDAKSDPAKTPDLRAREAVRQAYFRDLDTSVKQLQENLRRLAPELEARAREWFEPRPGQPGQRPAPPDRPADGAARRRLRLLRQEVEMLALAGRHEDADRQIERGLALMTRIDPSWRPPANLRVQLSDPLLQRGAVLGILDRIDQSRDRLAELRATRPDDAQATVDYERQAKPLVAAKRWREAAEMALAFLSISRGLQRLWQQPR